MSCFCLLCLCCKVYVQIIYCLKLYCLKLLLLCNVLNGLIHSFCVVLLNDVTGLIQSRWKIMRPTTRGKELILSVDLLKSLRWFFKILTLFYKNILLELLKKEAAAKSWTAVKSHLVRFDQMLVYWLSKTSRWC